MSCVHTTGGIITSAGAHGGCSTVSFTCNYDTVSTMAMLCKCMCKQTSKRKQLCAYVHACASTTTHHLGRAAGPTPGTCQCSRWAASMIQLVHLPGRLKAKGGCCSWLLLHRHGWLLRHRQAKLILQSEGRTGLGHWPLCRTRLGHWPLCTMTSPHHSQNSLTLVCA